MCRSDDRSSDIYFGPGSLRLCLDGFSLLRAVCQRQGDEVEIGRVRVPGPCLDRRTPAAPRARESWFGRAGGPPIAVGESCVIGWRGAMGGPRREELLSDWLGGTKKRSNSNYWSRLSRGLAPSSTQPLRLVRQISKPELYWSDLPGAAPFQS